MTNLERLRSMPQPAFGNFLKLVRADPLMEYVDWEAWLLAEDEPFVYIGKDGFLYPEKKSGNEEPKACRILADASIGGRPYKKILLDKRLYYVPDWRVKEVTA